MEMKHCKGPFTPSTYWGGGGNYCLNFSVHAIAKMGTQPIITARKQSLRRLCFHKHLSVILLTGWCLHGKGGYVWQKRACMTWGACVARGGHVCRRDGH